MVRFPSRMFLLNRSWLRSAVQRQIYWLLFSKAAVGPVRRCGTAWAAAQSELQHAAIGYFGASTGSTAALIAAARLGHPIAAEVARGGRPDLAGPAALAKVTAATLLIVGSADHRVIELNKQAHAHMRCEKSLVIVPGATHLFEQAGALEQVARLASSWFTAHRTSPRDTA